MPYIYLDFSPDDERRDSRHNPKRIDGYIHLDSLPSAANPEPRSRSNSLGYIYFDADSKPCGEGWIAKRLTCRIGMATQSAKQKVKNLFKSKDQKKAEAIALAQTVGKRKGENLAKSQTTLKGKGNGHDLINTKPIDDLINNHEGAAAKEEYRAHALGAMMGIKDIEESRAITKSLASYTGDSYTIIRKVEAGTSNAPDSYKAKYQKDIDNLNRYIKSAPKFDGEVQRGLNFGDPEQRKAFVDKLSSQGSMSLDAMSSWTSASAVAAEFAGADMGDDSGVILRTRNKSGVSVKNFSVHENEDEILVPKGTRYRVKSKSKDDVGNIVIDLEEY